MESKNNIVLVGAGYWGTNIAKNLVKLGKKILVYDTNNKKLKVIKKRFPNSIVVKDNFDSLINDKENKLFLFATPPSKNFNLIKSALVNKKKFLLKNQDSKT